MSVRTKILEKGKIVQEQLIRVLVKFDDRITALEEGDGSSYDDTELTGKVTALETAIGDEATADSILGRIKALEDAD